MEENESKERLILKTQILEELQNIDSSKINSSYLQKNYKIGISLAYEILDEIRERKPNSVRFGYARVSTKEQNEARQIEEFKKLGIDERHIYIDKQTGKNFDRPKFNALKETLRKGDTLYILDLKRFGRNYKENEEQFREITKVIGADIIAINTPIINTTKHKDLLGSLITDIILSVLNYETESDYEKRRLDQKQGIDIWRKTGKTKTGRPYGRPKIELPPNWNEVIELVNKNEITKVEAMKRLGLKKDKFYFFYNKYGK